MARGQTPAGDRRDDRYPFPSLAALRSYFAGWLPNQEMEDRIAEASRGFRARSGASTAETRLQLVKKCEAALFRTLTGRAVPGGNPPGGTEGLSSP